MSGKITSREYALIANRVYQIDKRVTARKDKSWTVEGFKCAGFKEGMSWGATNTDFKGCTYVCPGRKEVVVAFQGTDLKKGGDLVCDLQIALGGFVGMLPQYCSAALRLLEGTQKTYPAYAISFVGHSLGGAMAQVLGHWTGLPFVTFNAPGMWGDIQRSKLVLAWSPTNSALSLGGTLKGPLLAKQNATTGRNFRNALDPVSLGGAHYGPVTRFWGTGLHSMDDMVERIVASRWKDVNPFDPKYKE
ncbi:MAG TPA: hypothetical protein VHT51_19735, partial [Micropepsaceae bacterium]|nr:hypothetical protein [Micropepsaceae bacterium]